MVDGQGHPPTPPNCERFQVIGSPCIHVGGDCFEHDRQLVACFMRCAWLDEAERVSETKVPISFEGRVVWSASKTNAWAAANDNAELWRQWGQSEK